MDIYKQLFGDQLLLIALAFIALALFLTVLILAYLLMRREKSLQLAQFTLSPTGLKLIYEIDRDKKVELLIAENVLLRKEIEALKTEQTRLKFTTIGLILGLFIIVIVLRLKNLLPLKTANSSPAIEINNIDDTSNNINS